MIRILCVHASMCQSVFDAAFSTTAITLLFFFGKLLIQKKFYALPTFLHFSDFG